MHYGNRVYTVYHGTKGGSLKQPSVPHRFDPHLLGPLLLVSTPAVPLADRKSFPLAPRPNNKPLTSRQSTLKTATYIRVYADTIRCWLLLATTRSIVRIYLCTIYRGKKCRADRGEKEKEKEKEGVRGTPGEFKVLHNFTSGCCFSLRERNHHSRRDPKEKKDRRIDSECRRILTRSDELVTFGTLCRLEKLNGRTYRQKRKENHVEKSMYDRFNEQRIGYQQTRAQFTLTESST